MIPKCATLRGSLLLLVLPFAVSCDSPESNCKTDAQDHADRGLARVEDHEAPNLYSEYFVNQHDAAVSRWLGMQYSAMSTIALDDQGEIRLESYKDFSESDVKAEGVLDFQVRALSEFLESYQGDNKNKILEEWFDDQTEAAKILLFFLNSVHIEPGHLAEPTGHLGRYLEVLGKQRAYLQGFERYRANWNPEPGQ